ncbi:MAG: hypothetical protein ACM3SR_08010, partial [Ignavibacteriales bacterium]
MSNFGAKVLKAVQNFEEKEDFPQNASTSSKDDGEGIKENEENRGKNGFSSTNINNDDELDQKKPFEDIRKEDIRKTYPHSEACDCRECCPEPSFSTDKQETDCEVERIIYKTDDDMYQVIFTGEDG